MRGTSTSRSRQVGKRLQDLTIRLGAVVIVLVIFIGLAYLVERGSVNSETLLFFAGVIVGYLAHLLAGEFR